MIEDIKTTFKAHLDVGLAYVYFDPLELEQQTPHSLFLSILKQLSQRRESIPTKVDNMWRMELRHRPTKGGVLECLYPTIKEHSRVFVVVDALEQCPLGCRAIFLEKIFGLQTNCNVNLFITGRQDLDMDGLLHAVTRLEMRAVESELSRYVVWSMYCLPQFVSTKPKLWEEIVSRVVQCADGRYVRGSG